MGKYDSTMTRVKPVFDQLKEMDPTGSSWLPRLIALPSGGNQVLSRPDCRFEITDYGWGSSEKKLDPPVALLSWLIRHPRRPVAGELSSDPVKAHTRGEWIKGCRKTMLEGLNLLRDNSGGEDWHVFEGQTQPDVYIETDNLILVIEGKRTEKQPTVRTKWMQGRNQMLRHLDCAWEISGGKQVLGFYIVESKGSESTPPEWRGFAVDTTNPAMIATSLPHRGPEEQQAIAACFVGVTTWQRVCKEFGIDWAKLPDECP